MNGFKFWILLLLVLTVSSIATFTPPQVQDLDRANLLVNSGFEAGKSSWTCSGAGTVSLETSNKIEGMISLQVDTSAASFECYQDVTTHAAQFGLVSGNQGVASVWLRGTDTTVEVCSRQAGTTSTTDCVDINASSDQWREYVVPFVLGATSNGISIKGTSGTGTTYIDGAFMGVMNANMMPEVSQAQLVGEAYFAGSTNCTWSRTSTTIGAFTADSDCPGPTILYSNFGSWQTTDVDLPRVTVNSLPAGDYEAIFVVPAYISSGTDAGMTVSDGTTTCKLIGTMGSTGGAATAYISCKFSYTSLGNRSFELYGASQSSTINVDMNTTTPRVDSQFILKYYPPKSKIYSQPCTSSVGCENVFSAKVSSGGVVSAENLDWINGDCAVTDTSLFTCTYNSSIFTVAPTCSLVADTTSDGYTANMDTISSSTVAIRTVDSGTVKTALAFHIICQKSGVDFLEKNVITGTFANVVTIPGTSKPVMLKGRFGGASDVTVCSSSPCTMYRNSTGVSSVSRTGTGDYTINITSGVCNEAPSCIITGNGAARSLAILYTSSPTSTAFRFTTQNTSLGTVADSYNDFICVCGAP